jgi:hypothetical protein
MLAAVLRFMRRLCQKAITTAKLRHLATADSVRRDLSISLDSTTKYLAVATVRLHDGQCCSSRGNDLIDANIIHYRPKKRHAIL